MIGFFTRPLTPLLRVLLGIGGLAAVFPDTAIGASGLVDLVGVALGLGILTREYLLMRRPETSAATRV